MTKRDLIVRQLKSSIVLHLILGLQMKYELDQAKELSAQIATAIRDSIVNGQLIVNQRLPSESELCDQFDVSRPTVREALKRARRAKPDPHPTRCNGGRICEQTQL